LLLFDEEVVELEAGEVLGERTVQIPIGDRGRSRLFQLLQYGCLGPFVLVEEVRNLVLLLSVDVLVGVELLLAAVDALSSHLWLQLEPRSLVLLKGLCCYLGVEMGRKHRMGQVLRRKGPP